MKPKFTLSAINAPLKGSSLWTIAKQIFTGSVFLPGIVSLFCITFFHGYTFGQHAVKDSLGDAYLFYINDYPVNKSTPSWGDDQWAPNGLAHDNSHWYISAVDRDMWGHTSSNDWAIWRWPVSEDIDQDLDDGQHGVITCQLSTLKSNTTFKHYGHIGDLDHCIYKGVDYLILPLTGGGDPIIAFFTAKDLQLVSYSYLSQENVGWCAYKDGYVYTSKDDAEYIFKYSVNWSKVIDSRNRYNNAKALTVDSIQSLRDVNGGKLTLHDMQGGEFTPTGDLLYVSSGIIDCWTPFGSSTHHPAIDGIHVFKYEAPYWKEIQRSTNPALFPSTSGCFNYNFNSNGCDGTEPEGLTIWDLDGKHAPGKNLPYVTGQLHVLLDNHNTGYTDNVMIKHYKSFKGPDDISVYASAPGGEPATNPKIVEFLNQKTPSPSCSDISYTPHLTVFPPGKTPVTFTITDHASVKVQCTVNVTVVSNHDECTTAFPLSACNQSISNNFGAGTSTSAPAITGYSGTINDVWFKIAPPNTDSFSIETFQVEGGLTHTVIQVLSGSCGNLKELASDDGSTNGGHARITMATPQSSNNLYIRVTDYGGDHYGKFGIYYKKIAAGSNIFKPAQFIAGDGTQVFEHPTLIGDVNGDGKADLIFVYHNNTQGTVVRTKMSNGDGTYTPYENVLGDGPHVFSHPTLIGDVNGDGKADLIFVYYNTTQGTVVRTKISNGDGTYSPYENVLGDGPHVFTNPTLIGDVNGDGKADLIFLYYNTTQGTVVRTKISNGDGTYSPYENVLGDGPHVFTNPTLIGDVNGDGKADLIFVYYNTTRGTVVRTKISNGDGTYSPYENVLGDGPHVFEHPTLVCDVNGDGKADLIFVYYNPTNGATVRTKMSNGDGTYTGYEDITGDGSGVFTYPTLTGDINGDGKTDLVFVGQSWISCGLNIRVKMSNGDGTWCQGWQGMPDGNVVHDYPAITGDINHDKKTDLIFTFKNDTSGLNIRTKIAQNYSLCTEGNVITNPLQQNDSVKVYPNPTSGLIRIVTIETGAFEVSVYNLTNTLVLPKARCTGIIQLDLTSLANGIYFVDIYNITTGKRVVKKIVKIK